MINDNNGGAIAIKGFNYQKASIIYVIINNFEKQKFKVIPESSEDFEIKLENKTFFIQVKGTKKLSVNNLMKRSKKRSGKVIPSIIEKNLTPGDVQDIRGIFLWDLAEKTQKELVIQNGTLVSPIYSFSSEQHKVIGESLGLNEDEKNRLLNQKIYITPFSNNLNEALTMLKGTMVNKNLIVTNDRAKVVLGELSLEIDQKSEILVTNDSDVERKVIDGEFLKKIFENVQQKELFEEVLNNLSINSIMRNKVKRVKLRIPLLHQSLKDELKLIADYNIIMNKNNDDNAINYLKDLLKDLNQDISTELSIALAIDCFCELGELNL